MKKYTKNYVIVACIISVFFSASFFFTEIVNGMFYSVFWGVVIGFGFTFSRWCDKYANSKK